MSIINYSSANLGEHTKLCNIIQNAAEPTQQQILCWVQLWRCYAKINSYLLEFTDIIEVFQHVQHANNMQHLITSKSEAQQYIDDIHKIGGQIIVPTSKNYPKQLLDIQDFPLALYTNGNLKLIHNKMCAIVGSRSASIDALQIAYNFAQGLSKLGITVISGFANGIDTSACKGALEYGTVQVLGSGMGELYPHTNIALYKTVLENNGLFISEFPPSFCAKPTNFPMRNRIITGLSSGVLIGQASRKNGVSGTLVTLRIALHQNKEIFACPGNILDERSKICNDLIKNNTAHCVTSAEDIVTILNSAKSATEEKPLQKIAKLQNIAKMQKVIEQNIEVKTNTILQTFPLVNSSPIETVYNMLSTRPISLNDIANACNFSISSVQALLIELELGGKVELNHSGKYMKCVF